MQLLTCSAVLRTPGRISLWPESQELLCSSWETGFFYLAGSASWNPACSPACFGPVRSLILAENQALVLRIIKHCGRMLTPASLFFFYFLSSFVFLKIFFLERERLFHLLMHPLVDSFLLERGEGRERIISVWLPHAPHPP